MRLPSSLTGSSLRPLFSSLRLQEHLRPTLRDRDVLGESAVDPARHPQSVHESLLLERTVQIERQGSEQLCIAHLRQRRVRAALE